MSSEIILTDQKRQAIIHEIKHFFENERDEEIGTLAADILLDFIIRNIAPEFYNQGVYDAYAYLNDRVEDVLSIQK
ncbi:MAG: DUF2164 domain-containing protein [Anaerofustis sp.]